MQVAQGFERKAEKRKAGCSFEDRRNLCPIALRKRDRPEKRQGLRRETESPRASLPRQEKDHRRPREVRLSAEACHPQPRDSPRPLQLRDRARLQRRMQVLRGGVLLQAGQEQGQIHGHERPRRSGKDHGLRRREPFKPQHRRLPGGGFAPHGNKRDLRDGGLHPDSSQPQGNFSEARDTGFIQQEKEDGFHHRTRGG